MTLDGTIEVVMETWPLQLVVVTGRGRYHVALKPTTKVTRAGLLVPIGQLAPQQAIRVTGDVSAYDDMALNADLVELS